MSLVFGPARGSRFLRCSILNLPGFAGAAALSAGLVRCAHCVSSVAPGGADESALRSASTAVRFAHVLRTRAAAGLVRCAHCVSSVAPGFVRFANCMSLVAPSFALFANCVSSVAPSGLRTSQRLIVAAFAHREPSTEAPASEASRSTRRPECRLVCTARSDRGHAVSAANKARRARSGAAEGGQVENTAT
jgi:hypothetical protein